MDTFLILIGFFGGFIGFISMIIPLKFLGIKSRKNGALVLIVSFIALVLGSSLIDTTSIEATTQTAQQASVATEKVPAETKVVTIDKSKQQQEAVLSFEKSIYQVESKATPVFKRYEETFKKFGSGQATIYDTYSVARQAKDICDQVQYSIYKLDVPKELPKEVISLLNTTKENISYAYTLKSESFSAVMAFIDEQKPGKVDEFERKRDEADKYMMLGALALLDAKSKVGIKIAD